MRNPLHPISFFHPPHLPHLWALLLGVVIVLLLVFALSQGAAQAQSQALTDAYNMSRTLRDAGRFAEAIPHASKAVELGKAEFGESSHKTALLITNLALLQAYDNRLNEAAPKFQQALLILEKSLGADDPTILRTYTDLAWVYMRLGRMGDAERQLERVVQVIEAVSPKGGGALPDALMNLAELRMWGGKHEQAEPVYLRAIDVLSKNDAVCHEKLALAISRLGRLYQLMNRAEESVEQFRRVREIHQSTPQICAPDIS